MSTVSEPRPKQDSQLSAPAQFSGVYARTSYLADPETKLHRKMCGSLDEAIERSGLRDGMTISFHHAFRDATTLAVGSRRAVMKCMKQVFSLFLSCWIVFVACPEGLVFAQDTNPSTPTVSAQPSEQELRQLVAPIALYPDSLVAQILAASTYPEQIVVADRWVQSHPELKGDQLAQAVDGQSWDPSVKALTEFPSVLANMDKNLSWASSLGDAYINNQQAVMNAVQGMRQEAKKSGNLKSSSQVKVVENGPAIVIEPADPAVVYVPLYDPWVIYGTPVAPWPGWYWYPGLYWNSPGIGFGAVFGVGFFAGFAWGWHHWSPDWNHHTIIVNHNTYISHSRTIVNRSYYSNRARTNGFRGDRGGVRGGNGFLRTGTPRAGHIPHAGHASAFSGINHGGVTRSYSNRGFASMGGFHGGGGGFHGGGHR